MKRDSFIEGIQSALGRGDSLKRMRKSFLNVGYDKSEIEKAIKVFNKPKTKTSAVQTSKAFSEKTLNIMEKPKVKKDRAVILLIFILLVAIGILFGIFLLKKNLIN